jgi:hypothetical protein
LEFSKFFYLLYSYLEGCCVFKLVFHTYCILSFSSFFPTILFYMLSILVAIIKANPTKKISFLMIVWGVSNIQQKMLGGCFKRYIIYRYGSYDATKNKFKYTHCDLTPIWVYDYDIDYWFSFCHNNFSLFECWVFNMHHQFWHHFSK